MSDRAIHIPSVEVIFHEHHSGSFFEDESLWCETSLLQGFDEFLGSLRLHLEDECIIVDCIETLYVVTVYSNIFGKKFGMILSLDANIATIEQCKRLRSQFSRTDLIENFQEGVDVSFLP